jgi:hypothetical protein
LIVPHIKEPLEEVRNAPAVGIGMATKAEYFLAYAAAIGIH